MASLDRGAPTAGDDEAVEAGEAIEAGALDARKGGSSNSGSPGLSRRARSKAAADIGATAAAAWGERLNSQSA